MGGGTTEVTSKVQGVTQAATKAGAGSSQVLSASDELGKNSEILKSEVSKFLDQVRAG